MTNLRCAVAAIAALMLPCALIAQATVTVPLQDPVYRDLDRLAGDGVIRTLIVGQRPFSRREIARMIASAQARDGATIDPTDQETLRRLRAQYAAEIGAIAGNDYARQLFELDFARAEVLGTNSRPRPVPANLLGTVDADIGPLLNNRAGAVFRPGTNGVVEIGASLQAFRNLVFSFRPRVVGTLNHGNTFAQGGIEALNATLLLKNISIEVGRDQFVWGQGMEGGFLGSTSGRPLDMLRFSNDTAARAPWIFSHLGPLRGTLLFADLGPNQRFPHSTIIAYKLSGNPITPRFELSASVMADEGGRGAPSTSLKYRIIDLIPVLQYTLPDSDKTHDQVSNKFAGWEYRFRIPEWSGLQLYAEHQFDDMDPRRWRSTLWQDAGHLAGLSFAHLGGVQNVSAAAEFHHTGIRYYEHTVFSTGIAENRTLLGDPLGPQANAGYARVQWHRNAQSELMLDAAVEQRGADQYASISTPPRESDFHFELVRTRPKENRQRLVATWWYRPSDGRRVALAGGYEHVQNFAFAQGVVHHGFVADIRMELLRLR